MMKFSANISTMFKEMPFLERFAAAKKAGFEYVEIQNPYLYNIDDLRSAKGDISCDLVNMFSENSAMGCAAIPGRDYEFVKGTQTVIDYYGVLNFKKLHVLSGLKEQNFSAEEHLVQLVNNLKALVESDFLENRNMIAVIEPICPAVCEGYFLNSFDLAVDVINRVNSDQVKLLLDVYHLHKLTGDVKQYLPQFYPYAGHIQVSQEPGRTEPFCPGGEIDYNYVFNFLREKQHNDAIGLEYVPFTSTEESLVWLKKFL